MPDSDPLRHGLASRQAVGSGLLVPGERQIAAAPAGVGADDMISAADVQKLLAIHASEPSVLSLYLWVPVDVSALPGLPARADELLEVAAEGLGGQQALKARGAERQTALGLLEAHAREWMGHTAAVFASHEAGLATALALPCLLPDRAVLAVRPHVRPLLVALQRCPAFQVVVVDRQHAWLFGVAGDRIDAEAQPAAPGVRDRRFGGWYGLESYRINGRVAELAHRHYRDIAAMLARPARAGALPLVVGGHEDSVPAFLAALPGDVRDRFAGSFVVDPHTMTPARVRALAAPVIGSWVSRGELQLIDQISQEPPGGLAATGVNACLSAVNQRAVAVLVVPAGGLIPGFACDSCGMLASEPGACPHGPPALRPVPDLLEEMAVATRADGGEVVAVHDPPADVAARLRFPLPEAG
jgi:hypothetical protein